MEDGFIRKVGNTDVYVTQGDITRTPADAIVAAVSSAAPWSGGVDSAIMEIAGGHYHNQLESGIPLSKDLQTIVAKGNRLTHAGEFDDVVFVVDDFLSPLNEVVYAGVEAANNQGYKNILLPALWEGVVFRGVEKTPEEAVRRISRGISKFFDKYSGDTKLENLGFVVYNNQRTADMLSAALLRDI